MFPELRRLINSWIVNRWLKSITIPMQIKTDREKPYLRRKFCESYIEFLAADKALNEAQKRRDVAFENYMAWTNICKNSGISTDTPYRGEFEEKPSA